MSTASEVARSGPRAQPRICCLDLDTFFVSVERVLDPTLEGKPVVVGGQPGTRGVVTAASYEVRRLGVKSGMSLIEAGKLAPDAIYLPTRGDTYGTTRIASARSRGAIRPPCWWPASTRCSSTSPAASASTAGPGDEGATPRSSARSSICTGAIDASWGLPASAGIATSKVVGEGGVRAGQAAGVMLVPAGVERAVLAPLPVRSFPGIGPVAESKLHAAGYQTLGAVADAPVAALREIFGAWAPSIQRGVQGQGSARSGRERPAFSEHDPEGRDRRQHLQRADLPEDVSDPATIESVLCGLCERVCWRARKRRIKARTVTLKLRYADFHTLTRSRTLAPTSSELELYPILKEMLAAARTRPLRVRLLGVQLSNLGVYEQLSLFDHHEKPAPSSTRSASATASRWSPWRRSWAAPARSWWAAGPSAAAADARDVTSAGDQPPRSCRPAVVTVPTRAAPKATTYALSTVQYIAWASARASKVPMHAPANGPSASAFGPEGLRKRAAHLVAALLSRIPTVNPRIRSICVKRPPSTLCTNKAAAGKPPRPAPVTISSARRSGCAFRIGRVAMTPTAQQARPATIGGISSGLIATATITCGKCLALRRRRNVAWQDTRAEHRGHVARKPDRVFDVVRLCFGGAVDEQMRQTVHQGRRRQDHAIERKRRDVSLPLRFAHPAFLLDVERFEPAPDRRGHLGGHSGSSIALKWAGCATAKRMKATPVS
jgi:DNA polymerase-4